LRNAHADTYACPDPYAGRFAEPIAELLHGICANFHNAG
jgi:hypothetical protein